MEGPDLESVIERAQGHDAEALGEIYRLYVREGNSTLRVEGLHEGKMAPMTITRTGFGLLTGFWVLILSAQSYFLYAKFNSLNACRDMHKQIDISQAQMEQAKARLDGLKK